MKQYYSFKEWLTDKWTWKRFGFEFGVPLLILLFFWGFNAIGEHFNPNPIERYESRAYYEDLHDEREDTRGFGFFNH